MRRALLLLAASSILAGTVADAQTINFNDGTTGASIGSFYSGLGVTFTNAQWDGFVSPNEALAGSTGLKFIATNGAYEPKIGNPIVATFAFGLFDVSVLGLNVGANGARIEAYDAMGNLVGSAQNFGIGTGTENHPTLSINRAQGDIREVRFFQPATSQTEGMLWDNLSFTAANTNVPEPGTYALTAFGLVATLVMRRRRRA